ncbi:MAG TPA: alpha/beta fold hydrolase [Vicinamibacterales bacterium]|nr:alpha/beta fold hydrolase [Vicinamibacterales bacterium]
MARSASPSQPAWLDLQAYPFAPRYLDLGAGWMHYVDEGRGMPVLFVHGTPTWSFEFRHLIRALSPHVRCIAPDHLGFGLSERPTRFAYTPEAHANVLREFVIRLGLDELTLVVHDFGGPIGLPLCFDPAVRVRRLVLLNTWMWPFDDDADMLRKARIAGGTVGRWLYEYANFSLRVLMPSAYGNRALLTPAIHRQYLEVFRDRKARVRVLHALARALTGSRDFYASLLAQAGALGDRPALILWGLKDSAFKPRQLARWRELLPNAKVVELADAGHWPHEEAPEVVARTMLDWVVSAR